VSQLSGYHWNNCPIDVKTQVFNIKNYLIQNLGENLLGIYIHGSMCLGYFQPAHSDLDVLVITNTPLNAVQRFNFMKGFLSLHKKPIPIELSILCYSEINPWKHPTPYQFHFSEYWRERFENIAIENNLSFWDYKEIYTDGDMACHITLNNQKGICIYGTPINEVFPSVPEEDFGTQSSGVLIISAIWMENFFLPEYLP
jgi:predicted nucleotidyltransferase